MCTEDITEKVKPLIARIKPLAAEYYRLTEKPLGITGEIGEIEVARLLGLQLAPPREPGYDAKDSTGKILYQIKSRSLNKEARKKTQMIGTMNHLAECDAVLLGIMDEKFRMLGIWEASRADVEAALDKKGSVARNQRRRLSVSKFKKIGHQRYPVE